MKQSLIPEYINNLSPYKSGKPIEELAREKNLTKITKLASNENPLGPSPLAIKEMTNALWDVHRYPDMNAYELKTQLCELYNLDIKNVVVGNGSEGIMGYIARAFIQPGDEVLTAENTFIGFHILAKCSGSKIIMTKRTSDYRYDVNALINKISDKTKIIYIANPDNPTGTYIKESEFNRLMSHVPKHTIVILDEAYFEYGQFFEWDYPDSMNYKFDNVITLRTFSKAYGISGIRVGYGFAHEHFIQALHKVKLPFEPSLIAQKGAIGAIKDYPHLERSLTTNAKGMRKLVQYLEENGFSPIKSVTNFLTIPLKSEIEADYLYEELLNTGVIIRPLKANNMPSYIRISIGSRGEMQHLYESFDNILPKFKTKFGNL